MLGMRLFHGFCDVAADVPLFMLEEVGGTEVVF